MDNLKPGLIRMRPDYCPICKRNSLIAYTTRDRPLHYVTKNTNATTESIMKLINKDTIKELVCSNCGNHFMVDYSLGFPRAIQNIGLYMRFLGSYYDHNK